MATLVIRNVEDGLHARLKQLAAQHGHSMEEEARCILRQHLGPLSVTAGNDWVDAIRALFEPLGGLDLPEIEREALSDPPDFSGPEWDQPE
jgi:plasmid stability protein